MKLTIDITEAQVNALARCLNAGPVQYGCKVDDLFERDQVLTIIVGRAALVHGIKSPEVCQVFADAYNRYAKPRRLPKSRRSGPGGRA